MEIESIIELAEGLATEHRGKSGGGDPFVAFEDYEVIVAEANFGNAFEGLLRFKDDEFQVFVNSGCDADPRTHGRKNFTVAHEFGHYSIPIHRRSIKSGEILLILADDPATKRDVPNFCEFMDHQLLKADTQQIPYRYWIKKGD